jgi:glycosyltransferase involved in cell wall biosynthesis
VVLIVAAVVLVAVVIGFVDLEVGYLKIPVLESQPPVQGAEPLISVIMAARNEESGVGDALRSLLAQRYANFEIIVVDDRSTDRTGAILDALARDESRLRVAHVTELPQGWIGKNHALWYGVRQARGEFLLFTDADIVFDPMTLSRAMSFMLERNLDHITAPPDLVLRTLSLALVVNFFTMGFMLFMRPWKASDPRSSRHMGVGAFNFVRASAYRRAGTHERVAMRPDDDIKLGKILKQSGAKQQVVSGHNLLSVAWYDSLGDMVAGMRKNGFAGFEYSVLALLGATIVALLLNVWPFIAVWITTGAVRVLYLATILVLIAMYARSATLQRSRPWLAVAYPVAALIFLYILWASAVVALARDGISWRDTHYSLRELRRNRI